jgi:DNA modification methylase
MPEVPDESVGLIVTSPPYWHLKDYGVVGQLGYGQTLHEYLYELSRVWVECYRVLLPGRRLCINIGDQFARAKTYGRYKVIPLHAEIIVQCERIGFDYLGAIIWQKKTTLRPSGGAVIMGSFPYPPNGIVEMDFEYILLFRKPGEAKLPPAELKEKSKLSRDEWKAFFTGHWTFGGERQVGHEAMFPEELPYRLIRMFSLVGETVLDPFAGSGTTLRVALALQRKAIGYEIQEAFRPIWQEKLHLRDGGLFRGAVEVRRRTASVAFAPVAPGYCPQVQDMAPLSEGQASPSLQEPLYKVSQIVAPTLLQIEEQGLVALAGIQVLPEQEEEALRYLRRFLLGKRVFLRWESAFTNPPAAYVYLSNRLFVNRKMIEMGLARAEESTSYKYKEKFLAAQHKAYGRR